MTTLQKLAKADKKNVVTKKDGTLKKQALTALNYHLHNFETRKFYTGYYLGTGKHISIGSYETYILTIIKLLGHKYKKGNDAPRGGVIGNFIKVSITAFNNIMDLRD